MEPLISIIVPIYNIERYLGICIESLMKQTVADIEIILVNDGSTDRCADLCNLYSKKDSRIKVIHKTNGGLVSARKAGLEAATGLFAGYVDGDDWVEPTFFENLYTAIISSRADLVVAGYSKDLFSVSSRMSGSVSPGEYRGDSLEKLKCRAISDGEFFNFGITTYVWNKLFIREKLYKHQFAVDNGISIGEDAAVVYPYIAECSCVSVIEDSGYHYRQREDSMLKRTHSFFKEAEGLRKLYTHLMTFAEGQPEKYGYINQITDFMLAVCIMRSGGIVKGIYPDYCPYDGLFYGKKIVLWSAGTFGQQLCSRISEYNFCDIVSWVDPDYWEYRRCCLDVDKEDSVYDKDFDYVLIANVNRRVINSIRKKCSEFGIEKGRVLSVDCPQEKRQAMLAEYLNCSQE